jgi:membrane-associated protein
VESFWDLFQPDKLIEFGGLALLLIIVFLESGVFFGFFLPGDSLLFTAGLLCYTGVLTVTLFHLIVYIALAAMLGYYFGYWFGFKTGQALYKKEDSLFFKKKYMYAAEEFYKKHGGLALIVGRFLPIIRTFAPILAGVVGFLWPSVIVTAGYYVGHFVPNAQDYLHWIIVLFIVVTAIPVMNNFRQQKNNKTTEK